MVVLGGVAVSYERGTYRSDMSRETFMVQGLTRQGCLVGIWALRAHVVGRLITLPPEGPACLAHAHLEQT